MVGYRLGKNIIKHLSGWASVGSSVFADGSGQVRACIFDYHRVADVGGLCSEIDNWNVHPKRFEQQAHWLATEAECVPLEKLFDRLRAGHSSKPIVALTFDDGYANFHYQVLPVLKRYGLPATLTVVTRYVGSASPFPFDTWGLEVQSQTPAVAWRPISWAELEECLASGLVSVGSHSHSHYMACHCTAAELLEEACISREIIQTRLGTAQAKTYCYPYGCSFLGEVPPTYTKAVQRAGYQLAMTTDLGMVGCESMPFLLPRVEVHGWDHELILRAKAHGHLLGSRLLQRLRREKGPGQLRSQRHHELGADGSQSKTADGAPLPG
jgi:peptidoglycan/xylan/chitin deacetylase (PgdA/CDA1 family)